METGSKIPVTPYIPGTKISRNGVYSGVPMDIYHSGNLCAGPSVSSSGLRTIFTKSLLDYWIRSPYNPKRLDPEDTEAFKTGRAAHHLYLGEKAFRKYFVVRPDEAPDGRAWSGNNKTCKEWIKAHEDMGLTILTARDIEIIQGMAGLLPWQKDLTDSGLLNNGMVKNNGILNGLIEHTIVYQDPETGIYLLSRPDVIPTDSAIGADIKTIAEMDPEGLRRTYSTLRYDIQAAMGRYCLRGAVGIELENFVFAFVSKKEPHEAACKEADPAEMDEAEDDMLTAVRALAWALENDRWPGRAGTQTDGAYIRMIPWHAQNAKFRREELQREFHL